MAVNEAKQKRKSATPLHKTEYLNDCFEHACEALQRVEAHRVAMRDAMRDAGEWLAKAFERCSSGRVWKLLVKRYKIGLRMAYYCRQVYERWEEVKNYPPELSKRRIIQALVKNPRLKQFDSGDLIRSQNFKEFLKTACKDWTTEERDYLKNSLGMDPELEGLVAGALKKVKLAIRGRNKTLTREDIREQIEETRRAMRRMCSAHEEVFAAYEKQRDGTLKPRPIGEMLIEAD